MAELFGTTRNNITMHLKEIFNKELNETSTSKDFLLVQKEGQREVKRNTKYYNLDVIIAVGCDILPHLKRWGLPFVQKRTVGSRSIIPMY